MPNDKIKKLIVKDQFKMEQDFFNDLTEVVNDYEGKISIVATLGVLDIIKDEIKEAKRNELRE